MLRSALRARHQLAAATVRVAAPLSTLARTGARVAVPAARALAAPSRMPTMPLMMLSRSYADIFVKIPNFPDSITEGTVKSFNKKIGDFVAQDELVATIETDKAGVITEFLVQEGGQVQKDQNIFKLSTDAVPAAKPAAPAAAAAPAAPAAPAAAPAAPAAAPSPAAAAAAAPKPEAPKPAEAKKEPAPAPVPGSREERRVKMTNMRARIGQRLKEAQNTAASLTTFNEVDMSNIMELRNKHKDEILKKHGVKLGFMSIFVKAATIALQEMPAVNAYIEDKEIVYHDYVDISVAVATPKGLVTPVLRNCETLSLLGIERAVADLGAKARDNKITLEELAGGTFTISNGGVYGSLMGTPIINVPQSAILGMHGIKERPVVVDGKIVARPMMYIALTYDHRMIDGREAVTFLARVKSLVEDPERLLFDI